ncbi:ArsR family transcriptional regulator [Desulfosporosinus fructosivorans]|uniref:ArsR family transcriptional regulator n=1 Tax=Desulfosporosinus fructosivorans TaxID=2018669 RepID=A0A4Z0R7J0_9FIRM|nr:metalloregulator ArsR/SmtB family transcription factor [Desulfosporosinus fructosivorans]TGE37556.1 ArsR family transcriptional regulator [Desulfosporosinus fructosivorans]
MYNLVNIFKLLSDETRLRIIILLSQQELCVCQLSGILDVPQPTVSKNLSKLRDMNLVFGRRNEKFVFYTLTSENLILTNTVKNILDSLVDYPQLISDKNRAVDKEKYLNQCCVNCD